MLEGVVNVLNNTMTDVFRYGNIEYIKWDYNRQFSDVFSHRKGARNGEFFHRYILGLYEIWSALTEKFPEILFEACSSGGNRFDLATFCYMPQCWTSDNTDALDRVFIQSGTSYGYPQSVMTMHVSASPSFANFRASSIEDRFNVASFGLLGYELDVSQLSRIDKAAVIKQIEYYKAHRRLLQFGEFSRIGDFFTDDIAKWQITAQDRSEAMLGYFVDRVKPNFGNDSVHFVNLDSENDYSLTARIQILNIRNFGEIINVPLPKKFDMEEGKLYNFLVDTVHLSTEKEEYAAIGGDALMNSGFKPHQHFALSGYKLGTTRMLFDTDSRMYYLCRKDAAEE